ncbi:MAG: serine/threonine-protein kinase [Phycisphaerales bacterium]|nr:serine/threonine-protein kinase [Phycisphaerales bacterium]
MTRTREGNDPLGFPSTHQMDATQQDVKDLFLQAMDVPDGDRAAFIDGACGQDRALRGQLEELLETYEQAQGFLTSPTIKLTDENREAGAGLSLSPGTRIGPYEVVTMLGEGGFGEVYEARQFEPVRRRVALKAIKLGMDTREVIARFEAERQALAMMDHPNIAVVFDAGATKAGRPYFVMELVQGLPITQYCDEKKMTVRERLLLFMKVCRAVQHAHQKGIIHRDLKPSNVLVTTTDEKPLPKVIDFGIAKAVEKRAFGITLMTRAGQFVGTPAYVSPEQVGTAQFDTDTRSDVYSLGVLLYELLTGVTPLDSNRLRKSSLSELERVIREHVPRPPSRRLQTMKERLPEVAGHRRTNGPNLLRLVDGDLDWIVMKSLEKDRSRRYPTANALAADIERYLTDQPVEACPPGAAYRFRKFARRYRASLALSTVAVVVLIALVSLSVASAVRARRAEKLASAEARSARRELDKTVAIGRFVRGMLSGLHPAVAQGADRTLLRGILEQAARRAGDELANQPEVEASIRDLIGATYFKIGDYDTAESQFLRQLHVAKTHLGPDHTETLNAIKNLGAVYQKQSRYGEAEPLLRSLAERTKSVLGENHDDHLEAINMLAVVREGLGDYERAAEILEDLWETRKRKNGPAGGETLLVMNNLASVYHNQDKLEQAAAIYEEVLAAQEQSLGDHHPRTLVSMNNLANVYKDQNRVETAERLFVRALHIKGRILSENHPSIAATQNNLGLLYKSCGRLDEAEDYITRALHTCLTAFGEDHAKTIALRNSLARLYRKQERSEDALPLLQSALKSARKVLGDRHPYTLGILTELATSLNELDRWTHAERYAREAERMSRAMYGQDDWRYGYQILTLGASLRGQDRYSEAEPLLLQAHLLLQEHHGSAHPRTLQAVEEIAGMYEALGESNSAADWRKRLNDARSYNE